MRSYLCYALSPLLLLGVAHAQGYGGDPNAPQYRYPASTPQYGDGQPYAGQPEYNYGQPGYDDEDEGDAEYFDDASTFDESYDSEAYLEFDNTLAPYGSWVDVADYGRVWTPSSTVVGGDFSPYSSGGRFELTDYGWTWVSDWDWGWAPFHYGRWMSLDGYGWCWRPGRACGPAWVSWRTGGGYVGWAPLPPAGVRIAPPVGGVNTPWRFTTATQFGTARPAFIPAASYGAVFRHTTPVVNVQTFNNTRINAGPNAQVLSAAAGRAFVPTPIRSFPVAVPHAAIIPRVTPATGRMPQAVNPQSALGAPLGAYRAPSPSLPNANVAPHSASPSLPNTNLAVRPSAPPASPSPSYRAPMPAYPNRPYTYQPAPSYRPMQSPPHSTAPTFAPHYNSAPSVTPHYTSPSFATPHYSAPSPSYAAPRYNAPSYAAPRYNAPSYSAPHYSAPSPSYAAPRYSAPSYAAPRYSAPSYAAPRYNAPSYSAPRYSAPSPSYAAPRYSAPSYSAPRYSAPSYSAPHYSAPSPSYSAPHYSAPSYSAPHYSAPSAPRMSAPSSGFGGGSFRRR